MQASITLKVGKERPLLTRHPWVYSNAIERVDGKIYPGATVQVLAHDGKFIAKGLYSPTSLIRVRVLTWDESKIIDHDFFKERISK